MFWIYFENNKQDFWCIYVWTAVFWLTWSSSVMKTEYGRKTFKLWITNYIHRREVKKYKYLQQTKSGDRLQNFAFSSPKLKEKWIYLHNAIEIDLSTRMNIKKSVHLFRMELETKWTNEEMEEKNKSNNWLKKHMAHDWLVVYFAVFAFGTEYMNYYYLFGIVRIYIKLTNIRQYCRLSRLRLLLLLECWTNIYAFDLHLNAIYSFSYQITRL